MSAGCEAHEVNDRLQLDVRILQKGPQPPKRDRGRGKFATEGDDGLAIERHGFVRFSPVALLGTFHPLPKENFPDAAQKSIALSAPIWTSKRSPKGFTRL